MSMWVLQWVGALAMIGFGAALDVGSLVEKVRAIVRQGAGKSLVLVPWFFYTLSVISFSRPLHWPALRVFGGLTLFHFTCQILLPVIVILVRSWFTSR